MVQQTAAHSEKRIDSGRAAGLCDQVEPQVTFNPALLKTRECFLAPSQPWPAHGLTISRDREAGWLASIEQMILIFPSICSPIYELYTYREYVTSRRRIYDASPNHRGHWGA